MEIIVVIDDMQNFLVSDITFSDKSGISGVWAPADGLGVMVCQQ